MERLTKRDENGEAFIVLNADSQDWTVSANPLYEYTIQCEAIDKLAELEDAEEQGLLLRLPCPIGTKVYALVNECEEMYEPSSWYTTISEEKFDFDMIGVFGKEVFLTREEAKAALAEKGGAE